MDFEQRDEVNNPYTNTLNNQNNPITNSPRGIKPRFIPDTAAMAHIITDIRLFTVIRSCKRTISQGNASRKVIQGYGDVFIRFLDTKKDFVLKNCFYMPDLGVNLISQAELRNTTSIFTNNEVSLYKEQELITKGSKKNNLYELNIRVFKPNKRSKSIQKTYLFLSNIENLIHSRFGHCGNNSLLRIKENTIGLDTSSSPSKIDNCEVCLRANLKNTIYKNSTNTASYNILEKIRSDLIGLITPTDIYGFRYIITFLDSNSRYLDIELIKTKDEALAAFKRYKARNENTSKGHRIKSLKGDNGREYINKAFRAFLQQEGIIYEPSSPYTPEQNGRAERINQTLFRKVRAILYNANMPIYLWGKQQQLLHIYITERHIAL